MIHEVHHHHHLSLNREGRWGTTDGGSGGGAWGWGGVKNQLLKNILTFRSLQENHPVQSAKRTETISFISHKTISLLSLFPCLSLNKGKLPLMQYALNIWFKKNFYHSDQSD